MKNDDRPWLIPVPCVNHKIELAVKDAFEAAFTNVDNLYQSIFYLLKNYGAIKSDVQEAAKVLNISYLFPKLSGTRFVSHHVRALERMLNMWPAIISAFENTLVTRKHKSETKAKIQGLLKDFRSYDVLILTFVYLDILEKTSPASIIFDSNDTILIDITATIKRTQLELKELEETAGTVEEFDSHVSQFKITEYEAGQTLSGTLVKYGHMPKKPENRENIKIQFEDFKNISKLSLENVASEKRNVSEALQQTLTHRFESFKHDFFTNNEWIDPRNCRKIVTMAYQWSSFFLSNLNVLSLTKDLMQQNPLQSSSDLEFLLKQPTVQNSSQVPSPQKKCGLKSLLYINRSFQMCAS